MDRIAKAGLRYTQFHSTALCSPTRAALIPGRNHHSVGFGVIGEMSTGFPGYDSIIGPESATIGTILRDNGYATSWFGKNHNTPTYLYSAAGPFDQWPIGMGFQYFYGFMGGETDQWTPYLYPEHDTRLPVDRQTRLQPHHRFGRRGRQIHEQLECGGAGDTVLRVLRARAARTRRTSRRRSGSRNSRGKFDMGWEKLRDQIFANQKRLGVIPAGTSLPRGRMTCRSGTRFPWCKKNFMPTRPKCLLPMPPIRTMRSGSDPGGRRHGQARQHADHLHQRRQRHERGGHPQGTFNQMTAYNGILTLRKPYRCCITKTGVRTRPTRICRWRGPGRSIHRSSGPSRSHRTSAGRGRAWSSHGRVTSRTWAASVASSIT